MRASLLTFLFVARVSSAFAQIDYFAGEIDYWNERKPTPIPADPSEKGPTKSQGPIKTSEPFDWKPYLDPQTTEFFKEGEYTPPAPFMEIVRNPSDENLKKWFAYIEKRNDLSRRLQQRVGEYLGKASVPPAIQTTVAERISSLPTTSEDQKRFRFRFYFDSACPHCRKMFDTMAEIARRGFLVEARQIDQGPVRGLPLPSVPATKEEVQKQHIQSVPFLLIGDLQNRSVYSLTGYQSVEAILQALRQRRSM